MKIKTTRLYSLKALISRFYSIFENIWGWLVVLLPFLVPAGVLSFEFSLWVLLGFDFLAGRSPSFSRKRQVDAVSSAAS